MMKSKQEDNRKEKNHEPRCGNKEPEVTELEHKVNGWTGEKAARLQRALSSMLRSITLYNQG